FPFYPKSFAKQIQRKSYAVIAMQTTGVEELEQSYLQRSKTQSRKQDTRISIYIPTRSFLEQQHFGKLKDLLKHSLKKIPHGKRYISVIHFPSTMSHLCKR